MYGLLNPKIHFMLIVICFSVISWQHCFPLHWIHGIKEVHYTNSKMRGFFWSHVKIGGSQLLLYRLEIFWEWVVTKHIPTNFKLLSIQVSTMYLSCFSTIDRDKYRSLVTFEYYNERQGSLKLGMRARNGKTLFPWPWSKASHGC